MTSCACAARLHLQSIGVKRTEKINWDLGGLRHRGLGNLVELWQRHRTPETLLGERRDATSVLPILRHIASVVIAF